MAAQCQQLGRCGAIAGTGRTRVTAYDRGGFGRSDQPFDGYDYDIFADDLADIMEAAEVEDALLVGFSMGGGEVARYLSRHEKAGVSKVALISSVVPFKQQTADNPGGAPAKVFEDMKAGIRDDRAGFMQSFAPQFFGNGWIARAVSDGVLVRHKDQMVRDLLAFIDEV
ncbi:MAG: alpha/beta fold hydrolase [Sphingomonas sp.]